MGLRRLHTLMTQVLLLNVIPRCNECTLKTRLSKEQTTHHLDHRLMNTWSYCCILRYYFFAILRNGRSLANVFWLISWFSYVCWFGDDIYCLKVWMVFTGSFFRKFILKVFAYETGQRRKLVHFCSCACLNKMSYQEKLQLVKMDAFDRLCFAESSCLLAEVC